MEIQFNEFKDLIIDWASEKKAENLLFFDVRGKSDYVDGIIICHGSGDLHIKAIAENIIDNAKKSKIQITSIEGMKNLSWVLIDFVEIIVHIFNEDSRNYYKLEELWNIISQNKQEIEMKNAEKKDI